MGELGIRDARAQSDIVTAIEYFGTGAIPMWETYMVSRFQIGLSSLGLIGLLLPLVQISTNTPKLQRVLYSHSLPFQTRYIASNLSSSSPR